jgi:hypothetical protein
METLEGLTAIDNDEALQIVGGDWCGFSDGLLAGFLICLCF